MARTTLALRKSLAQKAYARTAAYDAAISNWFANELGEAAPAYRAFGGKLARSAALRREPAPERGVLSHARAALRRRDRAAGAGQAALLQQHQRHRRGLRMHRGVRSAALARLRDRQARQSVRRRRRREPGRGLPQGARLRFNVRVRRHRGAQRHARCRGGARDHGDLHRGDHRAGRDRGGDRDRRREEESAPAARRRPARSARRRPDGEIRRGRAAGAVARQRGGRRDAADGRHEARAERGRARRFALRIPRRQARQVEHDRLRQGPRHCRHRRRADEPRRFGAHRGAQGRGCGEGIEAVRRRSPKARWSRPTPSSRSPTGCWSRSRPARPR